MKLKPGLSSYLDFLRFTAALCVLLAHLSQGGIDLSWIFLSHFSHGAVVVFFVLSGFIIHQSTTSKPTTARSYAIARISRIYSVALPAVIFSAVAAYAINIWVPDIANRFLDYRPFSLWDIASSLFFLNESWNNPASLALNAPYWSLCYEVWFYVLFGIFLFCKPPHRWWLILLASLIAGPAILVMLPCWVAGAWLSANFDWEKKWNTTAAWAGFILPLLIIAIIHYAELDIQVRQWLKDQLPFVWRLRASQRFITDYLIAILLVWHIRSFTSLPQWVDGFFQRWKTVFSYLAGFSFTTYLFHRPLARILELQGPSADGDLIYPSLAAAGILLTCWLISFGTEKQLPKWRSALDRMIPKGSK